MRGVTTYRPAPGVLSACDIHGCAVVDTRNDQWLYFTGDEAWAWETTELLGTSDHLEPSDLPYLNFFLDSGLMVAEDETYVPLSRLEPEVFEYEKAMPVRSVSLERQSSTILRRAWRRAARVQRNHPARTLEKARRIHQSDLPYADADSLRRLYVHVINSVPWWVVRTGRYSRRSVALAVCIAAHLGGARVDLSFGVQNSDPHPPAWWCTVPEGPYGRSEDVLLVGTV